MGLPRHKVAPDVKQRIQSKLDPHDAIEQVMEENLKLKKELAQSQKLAGELRQEAKEMKVFTAKFKDYEDILRDVRKTHMIFLRDPVLITKLRMRAKQVYGRQFNMNAGTEGQSKSSRRTLDRMVEEMLQLALVQWHLVVKRLESFNAIESDNAE